MGVGTTRRSSGIRIALRSWTHRSLAPARELRASTLGLSQNARRGCGLYFLGLITSMTPVADGNLSHRYLGSLQLFASEKTAGSRSFPQIFLPARRGCCRK